MEDFIRSVLGGYSAGMWMAYLFFALLGVIAYSWMEVRGRNRNSSATPKYFSWRFFAFDNLKRYIAVIILIYVQFRFFANITGTELSEYVAFLVGFGSDGIAGFSKRGTKLLRADREKLLHGKVND